jgi:hypothetical protein
LSTERIVVAKPPIGAKCWLLERKGRFLLEEGPGVLHHVTCTHAGEGGLVASDLDGRHLLRIQPSAMGVWHLSGGFHHGLVIDHAGNAPQLGAIASIVWQTKTSSDVAYPVRASKLLVPGEQVLCESDCLLYEVLITQGGAGEIEITNGKGRLLWKIPSLFRGSFLVERVFAEGGLRARVTARAALDVTVVWLTAASGTQDA